MVVAGRGWGRGAPSAQLSVLPLQVGQEECQVPLSPTHTNTHASLYNGCFTLVPEKNQGRDRETC